MERVAARVPMVLVRSGPFMNLLGFESGWEWDYEREASRIAGRFLCEWGKAGLGQSGFAQGPHGFSHVLYKFDAHL